MPANIRSDNSGNFGALGFNGTDAVTWDAGGIQAGSYGVGSIADTDLGLTANSPSIKTALNASGNAPVYACRAWVNFNGNNMAIRASGNVSSITDNGVGNYTINFATAMIDINYSVVLCSTSLTGTTLPCIYSSTQAGSAALMTTTQVRVVCNNGSTSFDHDVVTCSVFR